MATKYNGETTYTSGSYASESVFKAKVTGDYSQLDTTIVVTTNYHKRSWRTESLAYVEWDTTTIGAAYPGGGTLDPLTGVILYARVL